MPLPNPHARETEQDYVSRCIATVVGDGTVANNPDGRSQAAAMCFRQWRDAQKPKSAKQAPMPMQNETESAFMDRCVSMGMAEGDDQAEVTQECQMAWDEHQQMHNGGGGTMQRAYSLLSIKSFNEDQRVISGIATTPQTDLMEDIVEPHGAAFKLPIPFLYQHDAKQPIGHVFKAAVTDHGIEVDVQLVKVDEPGKLKDRLDEAWQSIKHGLVRGLSIGFKDIESEPIKGSNWGRRIKKWSWLELSAVTIAANQAASIVAIKKIDTDLRAASGNAQVEEISGASEKPKPLAGASAVKPIKIKEAKQMAKLTNTERIANLEATRAANVAAMAKLSEKVSDEGRTKDATEQQEFDDLAASVERVDRELADCRRLEKMNATAAVAIDGSSQKAASDSRGGMHVIQVKSPVPPGINFARTVIAKLHAYKYQKDVCNVAKEFWPNNPEVELALKTAVAPGDTTTATWAAELALANNLASEFISYYWPMTLLGRIPGFTRVPFNVKIPKQTSGTGIVSAWVGEGQSKPVGKFTTDTVTLRWAKTACIIAFTDELARFSNPSIEALVRDTLARGMAEFVDKQFFDPSVTAVANVSPASITNGASNDPASGTDIAAVLSDIKQAFAHFQAANVPLSGLVWVMEPQNAVALSLLRNALGQPEFTTMNADGGSLVGFPVYTSTSAGSGQITLLRPADILMADDGGVQIDVSREASIQLDDNPTAGDYNLVSLWQNNLVAVRAERYITWARAHDESVYYITSAGYGGVSTV